MKPQRIGYMVFEYVEGEPLEQPMMLDFVMGGPPLGIIQWIDKGEAVTVFPSRKDALDAIDRTEHWRLAMGKGEMMAQKKNLKVRPVEMANLNILNKNGSKSK